MKVLIIGTFEVDGQEETGIFIKATEEECRKYRNLFAEKVILAPDQSGAGRCSNTTCPDYNHECDGNCSWRLGNYERCSDFK